MTTTVAPSTAPAGRKAAKSRTEGTGRLAALLVSPTMIILLLITGVPILIALRQSLFSQSQGVDANGFVIEGDKFVGLDNYTAIFSGDTGKAFWNAFYNTTLFTVVTGILEVFLGVAMALIMNKAFAGRGLIRASILVPWAIPTAVSALLWKWILDANGIANTLIGTQILWATDGWQARFAIIIADTWKTAPFIGLLVLAGLQVISVDVYEAASLDGANAWGKFWHITLPLVKPALLVAALFRILDILRMFDLPYVLIGRGKASVETLSILAFLETDNSRFGPAAAYAVVLFIYIVLVAYAFVKLLGADVIGDNAAPKKPKGRKRLGRTVAKGDLA
jgi:multiple sugar transport system permease protein